MKTVDIEKLQAAMRVLYDAGATLAEVKELFIGFALAECGRDIHKAADALGMSRRHLYRVLHGKGAR